ncbi:McrB family protein [Acinetobacter ursingii]|uniref:McrB family protein n=1 Tax=Acinetobacter ursingii TaxID=108980 RepID=UPI002091E443|nr:AAA family ATPase [Acinetobacter ursingii]
MNEKEIESLWDNFLKEWTIERVEAMTLQQYSQVGDKTTFTYWLEHETKPIANILGGSSFKFGIYHRNVNEQRENGKGKIYEVDYAWLEKYGSTKEIAFQEVKKKILSTIKACQIGDMAAIDQIEFSPVLKWKIAFLYQNQQKPQIISIFSKTMLDFLTEDKKLNYVESYKHLLSNRGEQSILSYSEQLVNEYFEANPKQSFLTPSEADEVLNIKYPDRYISRQKMTVVTNDAGREIALVLTGSKANIFIEYDPENNIAFKFKFCRKKDGSDAKYAENDTRHSNLNALSENLKYGNKAYRIEIETADDLEKFCEWYELDSHEILARSELAQVVKNNEAVMNQPLNRILFGAAGTGKTYQTINHALSIIEDKSLEDLELEEREDLKSRFDEYKDKGQIKFLTFHQSFSYEDFVEGIRAETVEDSDGKKNIEYSIISGVFKSLCDDSKREVSSGLNINLPKPIEFGRGYSLKEITNEVLEIQKPNGNIFHLSRKLSDYLVKEFRNGKFSIHDLIQKNAIELLRNDPILEPYLVNGYNTVWANLIPLLDQLSDQKAFSKNEKVKYVLIIDEINRGNISRIFGELITLIEDSKRAGADEALSVTLPYSKKEFSVPNNLYIIGTMNSSDRSLTGLDIALRRRFTFIEMPPKPEEIKDENGALIEIHGKDQNGDNISVIVAELLKMMNQRIEVLLDRDHCIGHANFMSLRKQPTLENLAHIFKQKIIPQLQEYFFDDWAKINLVLFQNGMIREDDELNISSLFPTSVELDIDYSEQKKIWKIDDNVFKTIDAFIKILGRKD